MTTTPAYAQTIFQTSDNIALKVESQGYMHVVLWPNVPQVEIRIEEGKTSCVLKGEDLGKFIRWLHENGYQF